MRCILVSCPFESLVLYALTHLPHFHAAPLTAQERVAKTSSVASSCDVVRSSLLFLPRRPRPSRLPLSLVSWTPRPPCRILLQTAPGHDFSTYAHRYHTRLRHVSELKGLKYRPATHALPALCPAMATCLAGRTTSIARGVPLRGLPSKVSLRPAHRLIIRPNP